MPYPLPLSVNFKLDAECAASSTLILLGTGADTHQGVVESGRGLRLDLDGKALWLC